MWLKRIPSQTSAGRDFLPSGLRKGLVLACLVLVLVPHDLAQGQVVEASLLGTGTVLGGISLLSNKIHEEIDHAKDVGDYLLARALADLLETIEAWKKVNEQLLDKAFESLDTESRNLFARIKTLLAELDLQGAIEKAQEVAELLNLAAEKVLNGRETYVTRYSPKALLVSDPNSGVLLKIRGVNLDLGDLVLELPGGKIRGICSTALECLFTFPASALGEQEHQWRDIFSIPLTYSVPARGIRGLFGKRMKVSRDLAFSILPVTAGTIEVSGKKTVERRIEESYVVVPDNYHARGGRQYRIIPPKPGYKWDLNKAFDFIKLKDDRGRCEGVDIAGSNEFGVNTFAHCEARGPFYNRKDGWATCQLTGTIYKVEPVVEEIAPQLGSFNWLDDTKISVDPDVTHLEVVVTTFDGRRLIFPRDGRDRYFQISPEKGYILVRPLLPKSLF